MKIFAILLVTVLGCSVLSGGEIERVKELTKEVKILNLLNGFELTKKQRITLKKYIREVEKKEGEFEHYLEEKADLFETGLEKSIEILASGNALPPSLRKDISSYNHQYPQSLSSSVPLGAYNLNLGLNKPEAQLPLTPIKIVSLALAEKAYVSLSPAGSIEAEMVSPNPIGVASSGSAAAIEVSNKDANKLTKTIAMIDL